MLNSCLIKTESLGFGYLGLPELSFKLSPHSCPFFPEAELVSTPLRAQAVITTQHVSSWVKNYGFSFLLQRKHHPEIWSQYSKGDVWSFFTALGCGRYYLPICMPCKLCFQNKDGLWLQKSSGGSLISVARAKFTSALLLTCCATFTKSPPLSGPPFLQPRSERFI